MIGILALPVTQIQEFWRIPLRRTETSATFNDHDLIVAIDRPHVGDLGTVRRVEAGFGSRRILKSRLSQASRATAGDFYGEDASIADVGDVRAVWTHAERASNRVCIDGDLTNRSSVGTDAVQLHNSFEIASQE